MHQKAQRVVTHFENRGYDFVFNRGGASCFLAAPDSPDLIAVDKASGRYDLILWSPFIGRLFDKKF